MPKKNDTKHPQHVIDEAVKRYMDGRESVRVLAKFYKISKAGFYLWVAKYKKQLVETSKRSGMSPADADRADKRTLATEIEQLRLENRKLRDRVVSLMIKSGEL
jgi:hypothetical protein